LDVISCKAVILLYFGGQPSKPSLEPLRQILVLQNALNFNAVLFADLRKHEILEGSVVKVVSVYVELLQDNEDVESSVGGEGN